MRATLSPFINFTSYTVQILDRFCLILPTVIMGFEHETYNITEGNSTIEVCIQVSGVPQSSLSVSLTTVDGDATG